MNTVPKTRLGGAHGRRGDMRQAWGQIVAFNPMSVRQAGRLLDICKVFSLVAIVCLYGTRDRQESGHPISLSKVGNFFKFTHGYGPKSNRHAGVSVLINNIFSHRTRSLQWDGPLTRPLLAGLWLLG